jgi:hypothetical protein
VKRYKITVASNPPKALALVPMREYLRAELASYEARRNMPSYWLEPLYRTTTDSALKVLQRALLELDKIEVSK